MTVPSSAVLVVCVCLPFVKVCGSPVFPAQLPPFCPPYVIGAIVFMAALVRPPGTYWAYAFLLRLVIWLTVVGWSIAAMALFVDEPGSPAALGWGLTAMVLVFAVLAKDRPERVVATCGGVAGLACVVWFSILVSSKDALFGATVSLVASAGMTVGCAWWWLEARPSFEGFDLG